MSVFMRRVLFHRAVSLRSSVLLGGSSCHVLGRTRFAVAIPSCCPILICLFSLERAVARMRVAGLKRLPDGFRLSTGPCVPAWFPPLFVPTTHPQAYPSQHLALPSPALRPLGHHVPRAPGCRREGLASVVPWLLESGLLRGGGPAYSRHAWSVQLPPNGCIANGPGHHGFL